MGSERHDAEKPIGVFDSGMGGLTVMRAIAERLPFEQMIYLGDTARLPYGTKSQETVSRYAVQAARELKSHRVKAIVVACNTASAQALPALTAAFSPLPVLGVVEPGARAAVAASQSNHIAVIATEGTVKGGAYERAIRSLAPGAKVTQVACPLFVSLAEEGWVEGELPRMAAERYLAAAFGPGVADKPDCLVLGCTHFPVLRQVIASYVGAGVSIVDSAASAAAELERILMAENLKRAGSRPPQHAYLATDAPERFARVGGLFLGRPIRPDEVALVDISQ